MTITGEGVLLDVDGTPTLRFQRRFDAPVERVWRAVTDEEEMRAWFPAGVVGERRVGAPLRFPFEGGEADTFEGEVTAWAPPRVFAFTWNGTAITIELTADGEGTRLVFSHVIPHRSEAARTGSGWHGCLANLEAHLASGVATFDQDRALRDYLVLMGPPLGTPGPGGSMTWEGSTHEDAEGVRSVLAGPTRWAGPDAAAAPLSWEVEPRAAGTGAVLRLTHGAIGRDPEEAARWHAAFVQLDLLLASRRDWHVDHRPFIEAYAALLG